MGTNIEVNQIKTRQVDLSVIGMTCSSCVSTIERSLNIYLSAIPNNDLEYDSISSIKIMYLNLHTQIFDNDFIN